MQFWQVYFLTTPHRWITTPYVFLDRQRLQERPMAFWLVAGAIVTGCVGVWLATGRLTCLLALDYLWNAWHFAAQHHGIYRVYGRKAGPESRLVTFTEKIALRVFLLYVTLRIANVVWPYPALDAWLAWTDWGMALIPLAMFVRVLACDTATGRGRVLYLASVSLLYLATLWAIHTHRPGVALLLTTAGAMFHAVEYLALISWAARGRFNRHADRLGWLGSLIPAWGTVLLTFVFLWGISSWVCEQWLVQFWLLINVISGFLHYALDGMIWKNRPVQPAGRAAG